MKNIQQNNTNSKKTISILNSKDIKRGKGKMNSSNKSDTFFIYLYWIIVKIQCLSSFVLLSEKDKVQYKHKS